MEQGENQQSEQRARSSPILKKIAVVKLYSTVRLTIGNTFARLQQNHSDVFKEHVRSKQELHLSLQI